MGFRLRALTTTAFVIAIAYVFTVHLAFTYFTGSLETSNKELTTLQCSRVSSKAASEGPPPAEKFLNLGTFLAETLRGPRHSPPVGSGNAFATFLTSTSTNTADEDDSHDHYYTAVRILIYQLLHALETRSKKCIPVIVLVTEEVPLRRRERLRNDGAIVKVVRHVQVDGWTNPVAPNWADVLTKLRLWEMIEYDLMAYIDGDVILTRPIDGVFEEAAVRTQTTLPNLENVKFDEAALPSTYVLAAVTQVGPAHEFPPSVKNHGIPNPNYFNAGFMVLRPSFPLFGYYASLLKFPDRVGHAMPEQNLLNYAHRRDGNMPWQALNFTWNVQWPTVADLEGGLASLHDKWWSPVATPELSKLYLSWRWKMEGFYEARDRLIGHHT